ncbi:cytochrome c oxidase assembly factor 6 homolog [Arctopsyche grandis]|uniref:cytochrome c oxidase assembly factor 6 homolog n=1 Tax=Arctopsyche grandis TaxID=121162 RepID=UPI00406D7EFD
MSFPAKKDREVCWGARDRYWECLDKHNIGPDDAVPSACNETKKQFENMCPGQWVKHFNRKRDYIIFKKQLEANGPTPQT